MDKETLNPIREMLKEELEPINNDIKDLKEGQNRLKNGQKK